MKYLEYRKAWNKNPEIFKVSMFPLHLDIESTNRCNLNCDFCLYKDKGDKKGNMDYALFKKIINESAMYDCPSLKLNYRGEPLLHPNLVKFISYAKTNGFIDVGFNTNSILLTEELMYDLIDAGLDYIIFSMDSDVNIDKVKLFADIKKKLNVSKPLIRIQFIKELNSADVVNDFRQNWNSIADSVSFRHLICVDGVNYGKSFPCPQLFRRLIVCFDGEVRMCCGDVSGNIVLGNVVYESVSSLWHSPLLNRVRNAHLKGEFNRFNVCNKCSINKKDRR